MEERVRKLPAKEDINYLAYTRFHKTVKLLNSENITNDIPSVSDITGNGSYQPTSSGAFKAPVEWLTATTD